MDHVLARAAALRTIRSNCLTAKDAKDSAKVAKEPRFREAFRQFDDLQSMGFPDAITNFQHSVVR